MLHSILIPHRNRNAWLDLCIWSIQRSAVASAVQDRYEVVIADNGSEVVPTFDDPRLRVVADASPMSVFNKPRLLNLALDAAQGDVLTWLDCDMIAGRDWMNGAKHFYEPFIPEMPSSNVTRFCYRVRRLPAELLPVIAAASGENRGEFMDALFAHYDDLDADNKPVYPRAWEAYRKPDLNRFDEEAFHWCSATKWLEYLEGDHLVKEPIDGFAKGAIFGNSQWSIRREALGDIRGDERYEGRGFEDVEIIERVRRRHGDQYVGMMCYDATWNLFHLGHDYATDWLGKREEDGVAHDPWKRANCERWKELRGGS